MRKNIAIQIALVIALLGSFIVIMSQRADIANLEEELFETQEQLLVSNDKLKMIEMRNEGMKYMEE